MIDFDNIDSELLEKPEKDLTVSTDIKMLDIEMNIFNFIEQAENYQVSSKATANTCLTMSLMARKMRQMMDKSRLEILKPYQDFIKEANRKAKELTEKLESIEKELSDKILVWLENPEESETLNMNVENGSLNKKEIWDYEIFDETILRTDFIKADDVKIKQFLKTYDGIDHLPGMHVFKRNVLDLRLKSS